MTNVVTIQRKLISLRAQTFLLWNRTVSLAELALLSELRVGPTKWGRSSVKYCKIYTLRLVRVASHTNGSQHVLCWVYFLTYITLVLAFFILQYDAF